MAHPTHCPLPATAIRKLKRTVHTKTATNANSPLILVDPINISTQTGMLRIPTVVALEISDTLLSVRFITDPGKLFIFDTKRAYIIPSHIIPQDISPYAFARCSLNAYVLDTQHHTKTACKLYNRAESPAINTRDLPNTSSNRLRSTFSTQAHIAIPTRYQNSRPTLPTIQFRCPFSFADSDYA